MTANATQPDWQSRAENLSIQTHAFIAGEFVSSRSGMTFETVNPATGATLAEVESCGRDDVDVAVAEARRSFASGVWSRMEPQERKSVLLRWAALIHADAEHIGLLVSLDMGQLVSHAVMLVHMAADQLQWQAEVADKLYGEVAPTGPNDLAYISREPIGVVGAIVPWNFPVNIAIWKLAPALAAGNSVVFKPSERAPLASLRLAELAAQAGVPAGVLNVLPGFGPAVGERLARHPDVDCIAFTGSTAVAKLLMGYAAESNLKRVWLEGGGKSPNLVFDRCADLDAAADAACGNIFFNQGAVCSANSRLLVQRTIKDQLVERLVDRANAITVGDPLDPASTMGAIVDLDHTRSILDHIDVAKGQARLVAGGEQLWRDGSGCYVAPTIFDDAGVDSRLVRDEVFGPVLAIVGFDTEDEAIALANASDFGLAASVWTDDLSQAHRVARELRAGTVSVNTIDALSATTPFGGMKQSGIGRDLSMHAFDGYTELKTTWIKLR